MDVFIYIITFIKPNNSVLVFSLKENSEKLEAAEQKESSSGCPRPCSASRAGEGAGKGGGARGHILPFAILRCKDFSTTTDF